MQLSPVTYNTNKNQGFVKKQSSFKHGHSNNKNNYTKEQKAIVASTTALGVFTALALLAKKDGYSLNPKKMFKNFDKSYWKKADFDVPEVIAMGAGSCLGGLAGGFIIDKDKNNRKAKIREAIIQMANVTIPIVFVAAFAAYGENVGAKRFANFKHASAITKGIGGVVGLFSGVFTGNMVTNAINDKIFKKKTERPVQASDFSAHIDDFCLTARQINDKSKFVNFISMCIPFALNVAGNEVGKKTADD